MQPNPLSQSQVSLNQSSQADHEAGSLVSSDETSSGTAPTRELKHTRDLSVQVYKRSDGLWDVEARLTDRKNKDFNLVSGPRSKETPVHEMTVCLTINEQFDVLASAAQSHNVPYPGYCDTIGPAYSQLIGLNLLKNFNREVRSKLGKTAGCTHITELTAVMPTAAVQAFAGEVDRDKAMPGDATAPPFYIDSCHALARTGAAVKTYYPQWFKSRSDSSQN